MIGIEEIGHIREPLIRGVREFDNNAFDGSVALEFLHSVVHEFQELLPVCLVYLDGTRTFRREKRCGNDGLSYFRRGRGRKDYVTEVV